MKQMFKKFCLAIVGIQMVSSVATAAIPRTLFHKRLYIFTLTTDYSKGLDFSVIQPIASLRDMNTDDIAKMIPVHELNSTSDGGLVASQIVDHSLSTWFNSEAVRNSELGRTAHVVEEHMESDVAFGGNTPEETKHAFKFAMRPTQTRAVVEYSGVTNAQLSYHVAQSKMNLEVREELSALGTQLVYNHINQPGDSTDVLSMRWAW